MADETPIEEELFTIGQVSRKTGLPVSTIRFYEKEFGGYVRAIKTPGGHRRFRSGDVTKLKRIHELAHEQGRALKDVRETLVSDLDPDSLRRDIDLLLEVFETLVQENVKIHKAIEDLTSRLMLLEEERKKKRFKLF